MLEVENLTKKYGSLLAVDDISFRLEEGELTTLLGPSGCGKSTTLHVIAGLRDPTEGTVRLRGTDVTDTRPEDRNIGLVFQHSTLFPHMSVEENLRYGLRMQDVDSSVHDERVERYLDLVQMSEYRDYNPGDLSGGEQRRIALIRALIYEPDILLLDEPLTGLDRVLREEMRAEIQNILNDVGVTSLYVTHDQAEALSMSDRVIVMNEGRVEQIDDPVSLYEQPQSPFVADFVGKSTTFEGQIVSGSTILDAGTHEIRLPDDSDAESGESLSAYLRPEHVEIRNGDASTGEANSFVGTVTTIQYLGHQSEVDVEIEEGKTITAYTDTTSNIDVGSEVEVYFDAEDVILL
jgi:ABC-type Fe3+/spermidine/putrescine transport system ATPase subunit